MSTSVSPTRTTTVARSSQRRAVPALRIRNLHKRFGAVQVLRGVDITVAPDELVGLVGENGAGKTTIVRCVAGAEPLDAGAISVAGHDTATTPSPRDLVEVVWQDLAMCANLDVVDNLFLGREPSWRIRSRDKRQLLARDLLDELGVALPDLGVAVGQLSGGQRQSVALARTLLTTPSLLVLDEPTAALDAAGAEAVLRLLRRMRAQGVAILLVSHDLDLVCQVADRVLVLRDGVIVDDVRRPRLTPDELKARISGLEPDSAAREQLHGLHSLVDELADVEPSAVVPVIISALSLAVEHDGLAVHLLADDGRRLTLAAALGLPSGARDPLATVPLTAAEAPMARAVRTGAAAFAPDLRDLAWRRAPDLLRAGVRSAWTVPISSGDRTLGAITGLAATRGPVGDHVVELATLYASHAGAALERDRLLGDLTRRNATLETLRQMLETLAGPIAEDAGLAIALDALRIGLGASDVALLDAAADDDDPHRLLRVAGTADGWATVATPPAPGTSATLRDPTGRVVLAATAREEDHRYALLARWPRVEGPREGARELLADGVRAVRLALERRTLEEARQEASALRRSNGLQRTFLSRLSHELRTPLTAIHGYADTLRQPDIEWDHRSARSFLDTIVRESGRLADLVADLLDASSIEAGVLQLQPDWCDLPLVVESAVASVPSAVDAVAVTIADRLPPVRADHDRLEQVLVNLVGNAVHHTPPGTPVAVTVRADGDDHVVLEVADDGPGLPEPVADALFTPGVRGRRTTAGAGLGLSICRGIVDAHGGTIEQRPVAVGTCFAVRLPVEGPPAADAAWAPGGCDGDPRRVER